MVQKLYDPISLITQKMTPPDYRDGYLKNIDEFVHKPTEMSWVVKKQGKTYHPYCSKKIEE